ncbi:hypothetical protein [Brevibacterium luteolum]|uniref:hypothetical protein n=1 Tax=Brevibacterium luteolum TaxID=199591 RepID=UPI00223B20FD|nr:hypothetical protein [Brevibacterium luteolum]MCT1656982.1 hypothetical protein [Brevibacterium luteolum]MCT1829931.1 hypothetical protein [Brevibacterium luteolum]MCT1874454.1 hypothetical protein [Brevibacterium luteolum]MCT1891621.1 hypothetical protein [Brevibacterium luteolum]MCT1894143.1 hypothetical protein [Brevibacterium luteolum]
MPSAVQPSKLMTVLLSVCIAAACGAGAEVVKRLLRGDDVTASWWLWLAGAAVAAVVVAVVFRSRGDRLAALPFIGSQSLGFGLVCLIVIGYGLPGMTVAGFDPLDAALTGILAVILGLLVLFLLKRWFYTPPDTPESAETD